MATLQARAAPICVELPYVLTPGGVEDYVAETAADPPEVFTLTVDFKELDPELRRRAYPIYKHLNPQLDPDEIPFDDPPPVQERYPKLARYSAEPHVVIAAWEAFLADRRDAAKRLMDKYRDQQAVLEGKRVAFRIEMDRWIRERGSERLRLGLQRNYKIASAYVRERAETEFPSFVPDTAGRARWEERASPSLRALKLETVALDRQRELSTAYPIRVVWLTKDVDGREAKREAVVVSEYLHLYSLVGDVDTFVDPDEIPF